MSSNTQVQGRTIYTERNFDFTPTVGEDDIRNLSRWETALQRQLYVGDVTKDSTAKQAALDAPYLLPFTFTPANVTGVTGTVNTVQNTDLVTVNTTGVTAAVTTGTLPAGLVISVSGSTVKLTGTPTAAGAVNVTVSVSKVGYVTKTFTVAGTIAA